MELPGALAALALAAFFGALAWRRYARDRAFGDRRESDRHRVLHVLDAAGVTVEIDARWPGRTRIRVPAPDLLPLQGPARLVPRSLRRSGRELSRAFGDLVWTGRGAADVARWAAELEAPLRALWGWRDRYTLQATLTPFGLIVHMPLAAAAPNEEPFLVEQARALARGLAALAGAALPEGVRFQLPAVADADCPTCWERVGSRAVVCGACGARQHPDCARWTGGCGRFGCAGERAGLPALTG